MAEIGIVARPHPVVGIAAELADRTGWGPHQPYIPECLGDDEVVRVAVIEGPDRSPVVCASVASADDRTRPVSNGIPRWVSVILAQTRNDPVRHILHANDECGGEARIPQFRGPVGGPESILEQIVLQRVEWSAIWLKPQ
jgi:hypothetical protein